MSDDSPFVVEMKKITKKFPGLTANDNVDFHLRKGEIHALLGENGAGKTTLMNILYGLYKPDEGEIFIDGEKVEIRSPSDAINTGIGFLTEDRRLNGIIPVLSVQMNIILANIKNYSKLKIFLDLKTMQNDCEKYKERLKIRTPSLEALIQNLSGGNQQKVLVARWLLTNPDILILDEPTRGIDVGAKAEIHTIITKLACEGKSIIMVSSEMPEILGMSDRILVMSHGQITAILDRKDANQEIIMRYAAAKTNAAIVA